MVTCYPTAGKRKAFKICNAFAQGCGGCVAAVGESVLRPGAAFFYGWTEHTGPLVEQCRKDGRDWFYADNAYYFGRGQYFRITKNALMHDGAGAAQSKRFELFGLTPKPWATGGDHVIVATQSEIFYEMRLGISRDQWTRRTIDELRRHTDRRIVVCHKPAPPFQGQPHRSFEKLLPGAWAVVSHSSSVMVKALLDGIPVFSLGASMATRMGLSDLSRIEDPLYPDGRNVWLWSLAANQWTREEMCGGICWRDLCGR